MAVIKIYNSCIEAEAIRKRMKLKYLAIRKPMKLKYLCQDKSRETTLAHYQYQALIIGSNLVSHDQPPPRGQLNLNISKL